MSYKGKDKTNISELDKTLSNNNNELKLIVCYTIQNLDDYFHRKNLTLLIWN